MDIVNGFPKQALPRSKKTKEWCKECVRYADHNTVISSSIIRNTIAHKKLNYDLLSGNLNMDDLENVINPESIDFGARTPKLQHYPIMNNKINLLLGEERAAYFDFKANITNTNVISEIEKKKSEELQQKMQQLIENQSISDEDYQKQMEDIQRYFGHDWQDLREITANCMLNQFRKEQNWDATWNDGFADVLANNEEIYQCCIEGGIPVMKRLNPLTTYTFGTSNSSKIEDADMIVLENWWSIGKITDVYYRDLSTKDMKTLQEWQQKFSGYDKYGDHGDPLNYFRFGDYADNIDFTIDGYLSFNDGLVATNLPHDFNGNVRVLQVYWKSLRKIKEIKSYNLETGEAEYNFVTEDYIPDEELGEEAKTYYVNEAWHGTMIGCGEDAIFVDMGPCQLQFNTMDSPSKCHFGIIGTIYNINSQRPYSMVDQMKPAQYQYDNIQDKLNKLVARNIGKAVVLNASMIPDKMSMDEWTYWLKSKGIVVLDPMKEGAAGAAKGKLAGAFNLPQVADYELGQSINQMVSYLEYLKNEMSEIVGITPQRMGQIANRETVGGVERSTLQSSHSTRWYFSKHQDTKKRVVECFLEVLKLWLKGRSEKHEYILPDFSRKILDIDGSIFNECDYGIVIDDSTDMQVLNQQIEQIAQAAMQNSTLTFSQYLKLKSNSSLADKIRMLEDAEYQMQQMAQQQQQQQMQLQQQQMQMQAQQQQMETEMKNALNVRDNETKLIVAQLQAQAGMQGKLIDAEVKTMTANSALENTSEQEKLAETIRQFDEKIAIEKDKVDLEKDKQKDNVRLKEAELEIKRIAANKKTKTDKK